MASKKPKSPPKLRLSGHPVRNSVFVTIGNCKRPQIWILLICYTLVYSETCNCYVRIVITYYIDISIKRFYRLLRINLLFVQTKQQVSISLLSKIMDFLKVLIESIYCCEEWTMIKNLRIVSSVFLFLTMISDEKSRHLHGENIWIVIEMRFSLQRVPDINQHLVWTLNWMSWGFLRRTTFCTIILKHRKGYVNGWFCIVYCGVWGHEVPIKALHDNKQFQRQKALMSLWSWITMISAWDTRKVWSGGPQIGCSLLNHSTG